MFVVSFEIEITNVIVVTLGVEIGRKMDSRICDIFGASIWSNRETEWKRKQSYF